ncbi:protein kinase domain protein [Ichthyophthirius multifiliis]|uniref:non-specific serine/threonine protein kinase n=1 Tax=Ichthyophthirius multifiliis TaxID=5932 RepID=G0QKD9_ICHMU|nr:protein kinase domain protein [Ichthyophthirius multifiliis]EGR34313.1 protein kinase domain protein [Ichthyophthirius multifiliis]|eukprot:XP_004039617.1 protein kinase domain protein [Ichthyophthirius multifiliis]
MGDKFSKNKESQEFLDGFKQNYQFVQEHLDNRFGKIKLYQNQFQQYVAVKKSSSHNKDEINNFISKNAQFGLQINSPFLIKLNAFETHNENAMCASINQVITYYDYYLNTVHDELVRRNQVSLYYLEQELWVILYSIISAAFYLEENGRSIHNIRPQNIYFTQQGEVKLVPIGIFPEDQTGYQKFITLKEPILLSPEQILSARVKNYDPNINQNKSDVYSIGMTMLYCASLQTMNQCYNYDNLQIDTQVLNQLQLFMKGEYSKFFNNIVNLMLSDNPDDRPTSQFIYQILQPFETQILNLQPFNPDYETLRRHLDYIDNPNQLPQNENQQILQSQDQFRQSQQFQSQISQQQLAQSQFDQNKYNQYQLNQSQQYQSHYSQIQPQINQTQSFVSSQPYAQSQNQVVLVSPNSQNYKQVIYQQEPVVSDIHQYQQQYYQPQQVIVQQNPQQYSNQIINLQQSQPQLLYNENTQYIVQSQQPQYQYQYQYQDSNKILNSVQPNNYQQVKIVPQIFSPQQSIVSPVQNGQFASPQIKQKMFANQETTLNNQSELYNTNVQQNKKVTFVDNYNKSPIKMMNDSENDKKFGKKNISNYYQEKNNEENYDMNEINKRINEALQRTQEVLKGGK